jgi:hypothetical protein
LVRNDEPLEPYDETLKDQSAEAKREWSQKVLDSLDAIGIDYRTSIFEIHAGNEYRSFGLVDGLERRGAAVVVPAAHLGQGEQLAFYAGRGKRSAVESSRSPAPAIRGATAVGSYQPLSAHLQELREPRAVLTFRAIERILGRALPASARKHRAWWANERSGPHSHARAWMDLGWRVEAVDFNAGRVQFARVSR